MNHLRIKQVCVSFVCLVLSFTMFSNAFYAVSVTTGQTADTMQSDYIDTDGASDKLSYTAYYSSVGKNNASDEAIVIPAATNFKSVNADAVAVKNEDRENTCLEWTNESGQVSWNFMVPKSGRYCISFVYKPLPGHENAVNLKVLFDGVIPYTELSNILLPRYWQNAGNIREDSFGNQIAPEQEECFCWNTEYAKDTDGLHSEPLEIYLETGEHTITLESLAEPFCLESIQLTPPTVVPNYAEQLQAWKNSGAQVYDGKSLTIEAETASCKTSKSLVPKADNTDVNVSPCSTNLNLLNYIGASNWKNMNDTLQWNCLLYTSDAADD